MAEVQQKNPQAQEQIQNQQIQAKKIKPVEQQVINSKRNSKIQQNHQDVFHQSSIIYSQRLILATMKESRITYQRYIALGKEKEQQKITNAIEKTKQRLNQRQQRAKELRKQFQQQKLKRIKQHMLTKESLMSRRRAFLEYQYINSQCRRKTNSSLIKPNEQEPSHSQKKLPIKQSCSAHKICLYQRQRQQNKVHSKEWFIKFLRVKKNKSNLCVSTYQESDALVNAREQFKRLQTVS